MSKAKNDSKPAKKRVRKRTPPKPYSEAKDGTVRISLTPKVLAGSAPLRALAEKMRRFLIKL